MIIYPPYYADLLDKFLRDITTACFVFFLLHEQFYRLKNPNTYPISGLEIVRQYRPLPHPSVGMTIRLPFPCGTSIVYIALPLWQSVTLMVRSHDTSSLWMVSTPLSITAVKGEERLRAGFSIHPDVSNSIFFFASSVVESVWDTWAYPTKGNKAITLISSHHRFTFTNVFMIFCCFLKLCYKVRRYFSYNQNFKGDKWITKSLCNKLIIKLLMFFKE